MLFAAEAVAIVLVFQVFSALDCRDTGIEAACRGLRSALVRGMCVFTGLGLFIWFRPVLRADVVARVNGYRASPLWPGLHAAGMLLIFVPWLLADPVQRVATFELYFLCLSLGAMIAAVGGLLCLASGAQILSWMRQGGTALALTVLVALVIPDLALALDPLWWSENGLLSATFYAVAILLALLGRHVVLDPDASLIGTEGFLVEMAGSCSGIEGFALITGFLVIYALLMRDTLRQRRFWLYVFPLALLTSWVFNVIRISALILIGAYVSPDLAVNGFHSFAGWLFFTLLALGVLWVVHSRDSLHKLPLTTQENWPPLTQDLVAAQILPFLAFMLSGLLVNTFWQHPAQGFPLQAAMMFAALWVCRRPLLQLEIRFDWVSGLAGLAIGIGWVVTADAQGTVAGLEALAPASFVLWVVCRVIGTSLLVPIVEELFFRGYLLSLLRGQSSWSLILSVLITSLSFAALHGRVLEAGLAGVIFALLALRRGRVSDAIIAHVVANTVIAFVALYQGDWSLI